MCSQSGGRRCRVLVVVGMGDERAIAAGEGVEVVVGSANATVLRERLATVDMAGIGAVYSFGVAGALDPALQPGALLLATDVIAQTVAAHRGHVGDAWPADRSLVAAVQDNARQARLGALRQAVFLGSDLEARDNPQAHDATLRDVSGADIIDNESHIAAEFARQHRVPFVAVRAVSDSVHRALPPAALMALDANGNPNIAGIARSLLRQPRQIPALLRTAWGYKKALRSLRLFRRRVGFVQLENCLKGGGI